MDSTPSNDTDKSQYPSYTDIPNPELAYSNNTSTAWRRTPVSVSAGQKSQTLPPTVHPSTASQRGGTRPHCVAVIQNNQERRSGPVTCAQDTPQVYHLQGNVPTSNGLPVCSDQPDRDEDTIPQPDIQCPMVEIASPHGGVRMVERFWSPSDITQYAATLKKPAEIGGRRWSQQLQAFCRTYRPTMKEILSICAKNMDASQMQQILETTQDYHNERPVYVHFEDNLRYMTAVDTVCEKIMTLFPTILNLAEVHNCKQGKVETVRQFRHRLEQAILTHGGDRDPNDPFAKAFLTSQLMNNMHEGLSKRVKESLIGYKTADPDEIITHATHAEEIEENTKELEKKQELDKEEALQLAMMDAITKLSTNRLGNDNQYDDQNDDQNDDRPMNDGCYFTCGGPEQPERHRERGYDYDHVQREDDYYDENDQVHYSSRGASRDQRDDEDYGHWT